MQKRKEEGKKRSQRRFITKWVCIAVLGCNTQSSTAIETKLNSIYNDYIEVDNDKISQIEFDFIMEQLRLTVLTYNFYIYEHMVIITSYMGYKTSQSDKSEGIFNRLYMV